MPYLIQTADSNFVQIGQGCSSVPFLLLPALKKYYTPNGDQDDLISIGTIGLIKGVSTFKPDKKVRLATYASRCIENANLSQWHTSALRSQKKHLGGVRCSAWPAACI